MTATITRQDCLILPYVATKKRKAKQFADALEEVFIHDITVEVFRDGVGWGVAVIKGMDRIDDPVCDPRIVSAVILLSRYDFALGTGGIECLAEGSLPKIPAAQKALTKRARRTFRIEDKLNHIISLLEGTTNAREGA